MNNNISIKKLLEGVEVEWKALIDIAEFRRGSFPQPYGNSKWYDGEDSMPFVQVVDVSDDRFCLNKETKKRISKLAQPKSVFVEKGTVIVTLQGTVGRVAITKYDCYIDRTLAIFTKYKEEINKKYFAYQLKNKFDLEKQHARGSTLKTITKEEFSKFQIPIPPLPIQSEIVRILDNFTELTAELTAELIAELTDRKKQYEYYRNKLLIFKDGEVEWKKLEEVGEVGTGCSNRQDEVENGEYPFYVRSKNILKSNIFQFDETAIIVPGEGGIGDIFHYVEGKYALHQRAYRIHLFNTKLDTKFLYYYMRSSFKQYILTKSVGSTSISIRKPMLEKFQIPIPPLEKQQKIVAILDKFDTLTNSISEGLSKEIALREKQYEYYRDLLLTFPKKD
jgi:type I restriction enzyme S subunit